MSISDGELLRLYAGDRSESAFTELVQRHVALVYSSALRQTNGDAALAEDVAQSVFVDLARKAPALTKHTSLVGWLYTSTRFAASTARRSEQRRSQREQAAHIMNTLLQTSEPEPEWNQIRPLLDEAMHGLDERDREAVLLRHFQSRSYSEIGEWLGLTENAARMRVERALDKLHSSLAKRGVTSTSLAVAGLLAANAARPVPAHLVAAVLKQALAASAGSAGFVAWISPIRAGSRVAISIAVVAVVAVAGLFAVSRHTQKVTPSAELDRLRPASDAVLPAATSSQASSNDLTRSLSWLTNAAILHLQFVTVDTGEPVPSVEVIPMIPQWEGWLEPQSEKADRLGKLDLRYPSNATTLELALRLDGFADTRLHWSPDHGDIIPIQYVARLDRGVPIGGRVIDASGNPIENVKVSWFADPNRVELKPPQYHQISSKFIPGKSELNNQLAITTDQNGGWQVSRLAEEEFSRLVGFAEHSNYVSGFTNLNPAMEQQLRAGAFTMVLQRGAELSGFIIDARGEPLAGAELTVNGVHDYRRSTTQKDGSFLIKGLEAGAREMWVSAQGYSPTNFVVHVPVENAQTRWTLQAQAARHLRLRIIDPTGNPIVRAHVMPEGMSIGVPTSAWSDKEGRIEMTNTTSDSVRIYGPRFMTLTGVSVPSDDHEFVITLRSECNVLGTVVDASNGEPVPKFRVTTGAKEFDHTQWNDLNDAWFSFADGSFHQIFSGPVDVHTTNFLVKVEADGYAPWISGPLAFDTSNAVLKVQLEPARRGRLILRQPDGGRAPHVVVGFLTPDAKIKLIQDGLATGDPLYPFQSLQTDDFGELPMPSDPSVSGLVAATAAGFAQASIQLLREKPELQLQPWGRLQVTCFSGGKPAANREYQMQFSGGIFDQVTLGLDVVWKTDAAGQFMVEQLPPGRFRVARCLRDQFLGLEDWLPGDKTEVEIGSGETSSVMFGSSNCTVIAHLNWPNGVERRAEWYFLGRLQTPRPDPPPEVASNETARAEFYQSEQMKTIFQNRREYGLTLVDPNTISAEEVEPGNYSMWLFFGDVVTNRPSPGTPNVNYRPVKHLEGGATLTIPAEAAGGTYDAGTIELKPAEQK